MTLGTILIQATLTFGLRSRLSRAPLVTAWKIRALRYFAFREFDSQALRLITRCSSGEQETDLRMAGLINLVTSRAANLNPSNETWAIYRSDDLVDAFEVKRYLDGDVDEI